MAGLLSNFRNTIILSVVLALVFVGGYAQHNGAMDAVFWQAVLRWLHVFFGILWIGLLYYFNFVQIRVMPDIPAELKPAVSKYIAPKLFSGSVGPHFAPGSWALSCRSIVATSSRP